MSASKDAGGGLGFAGALFLVLLVLKLLDKITWSWLWVTAPLWGGLAALVAILLAIGGVVIGAMALDDLASWRRRRKAAK